MSEILVNSLKTAGGVGSLTFDSTGDVLLTTGRLGRVAGNTITIDSDGILNAASVNVSSAITLPAGAIDSAAIGTGAVKANKLDIGQIGGRRNLIINGAMQVAQRGTSGTVANNSLQIDRFQHGMSGLDGNLTVSQETSVVPEGFTTALKMSMSTSETSLDAADYITVRQNVEAKNVQHLKYGTSNAVALTASFWVRSSVASTYTIELYQQDSNLTLGRTFTVDAADTWEYKTVNFAPNTTGTITNDTGIGVQLQIWLDAGSNFTSGTFSTDWQTNDNTERVYDTTGWLESTTPEFYITGVQLEVGTVATPFEHRSYGEELALCQRYYYNHNPEAGTQTSIMNGTWYNSTQFYGVILFPVRMRTFPSLDFDNTNNNNYRIFSNGANVECRGSEWSIQRDGTMSTAVYMPNGSGTSGTGAWAETRLNSGTTGAARFDAEL